VLQAEGTPAWYFVIFEDGRPLHREVGFQSERAAGAAMHAYIERLSGGVLS
jgi:hypothetical protein